jgi:hypothetical protein
MREEEAKNAAEISAATGSAGSAAAPRFERKNRGNPGIRALASRLLT